MGVPTFPQVDPYARPEADIMKDPRAVQATPGHFPPEHPSRALKGDLGMVTIPGFDSRPSFESPGSPFTLTGD